MQWEVPCGRSSLFTGGRRHRPILGGGSSCTFNFTCTAGQMLRYAGATQTSMLVPLTVERVAFMIDSGTVCVRERKPPYT